MKKTTKIVLGSAAAVGLIGGGTALAVSNNSAAATHNTKSSVSVVTPGTQGGATQGTGQQGMRGGGKHSDGGMRGGGFLADALAQALGKDATTVSTALDEVRTELGSQNQRPDFHSTEFATALAKKLGVNVEDVTKALEALPKPGEGSGRMGGGAHDSENGHSGNSKSQSGSTNQSSGTPTVVPQGDA